MHGQADPTESKNLLSVTPVPAAIQAVRTCVCGGIRRT